MSNLHGFCIMNTIDVAIDVDSGKWDEHYTADRQQQSDDGSEIMITGIREGALMTFESASEMKEYCYSNRWVEVKEDG